MSISNSAVDVLLSDRSEKVKFKIKLSCFLVLFRRRVSGVLMCVCAGNNVFMCLVMNVVLG